MKYQVTISYLHSKDVYMFDGPSQSYDLFRRFIAEIVSTQVSFVEAVITVTIKELK